MSFGRVINSVPLAFNSFFYANFSSAIVGGCVCSTPSTVLFGGVLIVRLRKDPGYDLGHQFGLCYEEDIKLLKRKIYLKEVAIIELRRKLELTQKQKDKIQLTIEKLKNSSKSLSKLIDCQMIDKCKTGLGYNAIPPPYTGNFLPPKHDLSLSGTEEFVNEPIVSKPTVKKPIVETSEAKDSADKPKVVKKNNGTLIIED
ncbi:hypothetical protein Tco_0745526 [Tanacetum coccineum]